MATIYDYLAGLQTNKDAGREAQHVRVQESHQEADDATPGGFLPLAKTYSPATGTRWVSDKQGYQPTGGGQLLRADPDLVNRMLARPDLQRAQAPQQLALSSPASMGRVNQLTNVPATQSSPLSMALRASTTGEGVV